MVNGSLPVTKLGKLFLQRFIATYDEPNHVTIDLNHLIYPAISEVDNASLINIPDWDEIRATVFRLGSFKAVGPDGFPALFFKSYWDIVGDDVVMMVRDFFITGSLHPNINSTNLVLIPKTKNPSTINHFRPIAVCNIVYKVISKILAERLKPLLSRLICPTQGAFVPGRSIHDNSVIIQEVVHALKRKKGSKGWMGLKIDLQKAYDRLSWKFLGKVLKAFGFHPIWIHRVMTCISSATMTILLNGSPVHKFSPKRGLRQGDPLFPYLFIIAMEVLSRLIQQKVDSGLISGFKISRHTPAIHHLFFADDVFLLGKCTFNEASQFKECLDTFCLWSGQSFNASKSNIFFNNLANRRVAGRITELMGFSRIAPNSVYLGLPLFRSGKSSDFDYLIEQLDSKLAGWKSKVLSKAKRLVLVQSIAFALPIYTMQTAKIPASVCSKLDRRIRSFWWGISPNGGKSLCLKAWDAVCKPKSCGGLGFRRMKDFNEAILTNWGWKILTGASSLCLSVLRARYLHHSGLFDTQAKAGDSRFWKAILLSVNVLKEGACYMVGDGCSIDPWKDPWVPNAENLRPNLISVPDASNARVKDFFLTQGCWDLHKLRLNYTQNDARLIADIVLPNRPKPDRWVWLPASNGKFSTKSAYLLANRLRFMNGSGVSKEIWLKVWTQKFTLPRHKLNWWLIISNAIPTRDKLNSLFHIDNVLCPIFNAHIENSLHLLFFCDLSRHIWLASPWSLRAERIACQTPVEGLQFLWNVESSDNHHADHGLGNRNIILFASVLFDLIWKHRNSVTHGATPSSPLSLLHSILKSYFSLLDSFPRRSPGITPSWIPPPSGWIKINCDAALNDAGSSIACVARNDKADIVKWEARNIDLCSPLVAEARAVDLAIKMVAQASWKYICVVSDSKVVIEALQKRTSNTPWSVTSILDNCKLNLCNFDACSFVFTPRAANFLAHNLAKWCLYSCSSSQGLLSLPPSVWSDTEVWLV
ncbi:hypothetical protein UlMin_026164 [Ulmus minor]